MKNLTTNRSCCNCSTSIDERVFTYVLFYIALGLLIVILDHVSPGGPCVPGMGMLLVIFLPFISGALFLFSFVGRVMGRNAFLGPMLINGGILAPEQRPAGWPPAMRAQL
jgi:hypothetical protein